MNKTKSNLYNVLLMDMGNGQFKVRKASRLTAINQFKNKWKRTDVRDLTGKLRKSKIVVS